MRAGPLFMGHGLQKLTGWFGSHGLAGTARFMESVGLRPGRFWAVVAWSGPCSWRLRGSLDQGAVGA